MSRETYSRQEAPIESTWNKESLFADWEAWKASLEASRAELAQLREDRAGALESAPALGAWLEGTLELHKQVRNLRVYAGMASSVDVRDMQAKGFLGQISGLQGELSATTGAVEAELVTLGDRLNAWLEEEPRLAIYRHYFADLLRKKAHTRSPEVEEILNLFDGPIGQIASTASELRNTDLRFEEASNSQGERFPTRQSTITPTGIQDADRERRRTAWEHYSDGFLSMINTFASNYIAFARAETMVSKARGFGSVLEKRLAPSNLPVEMFHAFMEVFHANVGIWHAYWEAKRGALKVAQLHPYDIWAPLVNDPPVVEYPEGIGWVVESVKPLGQDYVDRLAKGVFQERWVDWAPNQGKKDGAFCTPVSAVFTSYADSLNDVSVLAHELGHAMHARYRSMEQPYVYSDYMRVGSALGETPSNLGQALLRDFLGREKADDARFQLALIDEAMFNFHRYFFQMPNLARFELAFYDRIWNGKPVNAKIMNGMMREIYAEGYGETMVDDPDRTGATWAQFGHLFAPFYTFQYAVGISAAHAIADRILGGTPGASEDFIRMTSAGSSMYPMDLFKVAGVDMATPEPVQKTFGVLSALVDRMRELAGSM